MTIREKKVLARVIEIQKESWGVGETIYVFFSVTVHKVQFGKKRIYVF